jgi:hypothetical protein
MTERYLEVGILDKWDIFSPYEGYNSPLRMFSWRYSLKRWEGL